MAIQLTSSPPTGNASNSFEPNTVGLLGIIRILFRWSFVVAPLLALTVWFAMSRTEGIQPDHSANAAILLVGPSEILIEDAETGEILIEGVNPLQQLGGNLDTVAQVTVLAMSDISVSQQLADEGLTSSYEIGVASRSPIIQFVTTDVDPELALATVERLTELTFEDLDRRQDELNAPEANRIGAQLISLGLSGGPDYSGRDRLRLAIAAVGFTIAGASAFFLEGIAELWRRRKRRAASLEAYSTLRGLPSGESQDRPRTSATAGVDDLVSSHGATLTSVLHLVTGDEEFARDTAAATASDATAAWPLPVTTEPVTWLYAKAMDLATKDFPEGPLREHPVDNAFWTSVHELPVETRWVLALSRLAGFTDPRIAQVMGIAESTVARHRSQASDHLARLTDQRLRASTDTTMSSQREVAGSDDGSQAPVESTSTDNAEGDRTEGPTRSGRTVKDPNRARSRKGSTDKADSTTGQPAER